MKVSTLVVVVGTAAAALTFAAGPSWADSIASGTGVFITGVSGVDGSTVSGVNGSIVTSSGARTIPAPFASNAGMPARTQTGMTPPHSWINDDRGE